MGMIANKVMNVGKWENGSSIWKIGCDCGDDDCTATIEMEVDNGVFLMYFFKKLHVMTEYHWYKAMKMRFKIAFSVLFKGWVELHSEMVITEQSHIDAFIEALKEGRNRLVEHTDHNM